MIHFESFLNLEKAVTAPVLHSYEESSCVLLIHYSYRMAKIRSGLDPNEKGAAKNKTKMSMAS